MRLIPVRFVVTICGMAMMLESPLSKPSYQPDLAGAVRPDLQLLVTAGPKSAAMVTALVHSRPHRSTP